MNRKGISILLICVLMISALLTGCSKNEVEMYTAFKHLTELTYGKPVQTTGELSIDLGTLKDMLSKDVTGKDGQTMKEVISIFENNKLTYTATMDVSKDLADTQYFLENKTSGEKVKFIHLVRADGAYFMDINSFIAVIRPFVTGNELKQLNALDAKGKWLKMTDVEYKEMVFGMAGLPKTNPAYANTSLKLSDSKKMIDMYIRMYDGLFKAYDAMDSNTVTKNDKTYTYRLDSDSAYPFIEQTAFYTMDHADVITAFLANFFKTLSDEELTLMGLDRAMADQTAKGLTESVKKEDIDMARQQLAAVTPEMKEMIKSTYKGSQIVYSITENSKDSFNGSYDFTIKFQMPTSSEAVGFSFKGKDESVAIEKVDVTAPTTGIITMADVKSVMPDTLTFYSKSSYSLNKDMVNSYGETRVLVKEGRSYVAANLLADSFGFTKTVNADKTVTLTKGTVTGNVASITDKGELFLKVSDLEKLGVEIKYDTNTQVLTLTNHKVK